MKDEKNNEQKDNKPNNMYDNIDNLNDDEFKKLMELCIRRLNN